MTEQQVRSVVSLGRKALFLWDEADTVFSRGVYRYSDNEFEHISTLLLTDYQFFFTADSD